MSFAIEDQSCWLLLLLFDADMVARRRNFDDELGIFRTLVVKFESKSRIAFICIFDIVVYVFYVPCIDSKRVTRKHTGNDDGIQWLFSNIVPDGDVGSQLRFRDRQVPAVCGSV